MSKYKVGNKVVMEITGVSKYGECYEVAHTSMWNTIRTERVTEPLYTYTEPLEAKIRKQEAEITRLLTENEKLKKDLEYYHTGTDICDMESARLAGQNEAWELARKIVLINGYSDNDLYEIFNCCGLHKVLKDFTYQEAATKVEEWENAKEEIKDGDVLEGIYDNTLKCVVTNLYTDNIAYLVFDDGTAGWHDLDNFKKTGRHIDIDSFLKQIGGE